MLREGNEPPFQSKWKPRVSDNNVYRTTSAPPIFSQNQSVVSFFIILSFSIKIVF